MDKNTESTRSYYKTYDVENRIKRDQAHRIEFLITMDVLRKLLSQLDSSKAVVCDIGCGTGNYSVEISPFVSKIYACDLMPNLLEQLCEKIKNNGLTNISTICCSAENLSEIPDNSCDLSLCMGPLYHLSEVESRNLCFNELKRVTKKNGRIVITYLNPKALWANIKRGKITMQEFEMIEGKGKVFYSPFYFTSPTTIEAELTNQHFIIQHHVALDAFTSFLIDEVNTWDESTYNSWLNIVRNNSENPAWLEFTSHGLIVAEVDK